MRHFDLIVATLLFIFGAILSTAAYRRILLTQQPEHIFLEDIFKTGRHRFNIIVRDKCVGYFVTDAEKERTAFMQASGVLRTKFQKVSTDVAVRMSGVFNAIGQMTEFEFRVIAAELEFLLHGRDAHPIKLHFETKGLDDDKSFDLSLAGPVILREHRPGVFRLEYSDPIPLGSIHSDQALERLNEHFKIKVTPVESDEKMCAGAGGQKLDVAEWANLFKGMTSLMSPFELLLGKKQKS